MKSNKKLEKRILFYLKTNWIDFDNETDAMVGIRKIISMVRREYLKELKKDLEYTINCILLKT